MSTLQFQTEDIWSPFAGSWIVVPILKEDFPTDLKEALARRRLMALTGRCPCGAWTDEDGLVLVEHPARCPGHNDDFAELLARYGVEVV